MLKSKPSAFNPISSLSVEIKKASTQLLKSIGQKQIAPVSLLAVLSFTSVSWLTTAVIAPEKAQAYTARVDVSLNRQSDETFEGFLRRAETVARAAAQRSFDGDILVTDVAVTVLGQNDGAIAPILLLEVSRQAWRNRPDPQSWATYFPNTESLLGFENLGVDPGIQPAGTVPSPGPNPTTVIGAPGAPIPAQLAPPNQGTIPQPGAPAIPGTPAPAAIPNTGAPGVPTTNPGVAPAPNNTGAPGVPTTNPGVAPAPNNTGAPGVPTTNPGVAPAPNNTGTPGTPTTNPGTNTRPNNTGAQGTPTTNPGTNTRPNNTGAQGTPTTNPGTNTRPNNTGAQGTPTTNPGTNTRPNNTGAQGTPTTNPGTNTRPNNTTTPTNQQTGAGSNPR